MEKTLKEILANEEKFSFNSYLRNVELNDIKSFQYGELERNSSGSLFPVPFCCFGDYDNSCAVERSNFRVFWELYGHIDGVYKVYGIFNSEGIVIDLDKVDNDEGIKETICNLYDYPAIADDDVSLMEIEMEDSDFESWVRSDLEKHVNGFLEEKYPLLGSEIEEKLENVDWWQLYLKLKEKTNTYFIIESGGAGYIDVKRLMKGFTVEMLEVKHDI
jgi:hypothetical protein